MNAKPDSNARGERIDILLNSVSLVIVGLSGLAVITMIGAIWGVSGAGFFTELLAIWVVVSQIAAMGVQNSVLRSTAIADSTREKRRETWSAIALALVTGSACAGLLALLAGPIAQLFGGGGLHRALLYISPGILLFALNKIVIFSLNGLHHMRLVALSNALRMASLLLITIAVAWMEQPIETIGLAMSGAEALVLLVAGLSLATRYPPTVGRLGSKMKSHAAFGIRSLPSGAFLELNSRIDVLVLGLFTQQSLVGIYGYALAFAEGHQQLTMVYRNQFNPRLAACLKRNDLEELRSLFRRGGRACLRTLSITAIVALCGFPIVLWLQPNGEKFAQAPAIFAIIATGTVAGGTWLPFSMIRLQAGHPGEYSRLILTVLCINIAINLTLVPILGIYGAAIGTAMSLLAMGLLARKAMRRAAANLTISKPNSP